MLKVLLVAKSSDSASRLAADLARLNVTCALASTPESAATQAEIARPDVLLIDMTSIPAGDAACADLRREKKLPVLAIAAPEIAFSLDGTVDDFAVSPVNSRELAARARRLAAHEAPHKASPQIIAGIITIDPDKYEVSVGGRPVALTFREFELLRFLASNPGRVFTRDLLLNHVWGDDFFGGDRTVDVHIRRLRSKIQDETHVYIETVRNIGYRFVKASQKS